MNIDFPWSDFKTRIKFKANLRYIDRDTFYLLYYYDTGFIFETSILKDSGDDQTDFETNYKDEANANSSTEVTTQFEMRDKTLKLCHGSAAVGEDSLATVLLKVPGEVGSGDGRWISSGTAFFDVHTAGDLIQSVRFTDEDNILGAGAGYVVGSYTDDDADEGNQGWVIPPVGSMKAEAIGGYGFAPAGFYIKIVGKKGSDVTTGTFYVNLEWGKTDT